MKPSSEPLSHRIDVNKLPRGGQHVPLEAREADLPAIAARLDVPRVDFLRAEIDVRPLAGGRYAVSGTASARVVQTCVVSMEDFPVDVETGISAEFADPESAPKPTSAEIERTLADMDPPEPVENGVIDVGVLAIEFVALALDPFPRKPGAVFEAAAGEGDRESPFAALAALKAPGGDKR